MYLGILELLEDEDELPVEDEDPLTYIGSGTNVKGGVKSRVREHEQRRSLPKYVAARLDLGYTMTSIGVMLSISTPKINIIRTRGFIRLMEATFTYKFWTLYCARDDNFQYAMERLSLWDRRDLAWDGLCSHNPLKESLGVDSLDTQFAAAGLGWGQVVGEYEEFYKQMGKRQREWQRKLREAAKAGDEEAKETLEKIKEGRRVRYKRLVDAAAAGGEDEKEKLKKMSEGSRVRHQRIRDSARAGDEEAKAKVNKVNERKRERTKRLRELVKAGDEEAKEKIKRQYEQARERTKRRRSLAEAGDEEAKMQRDKLKKKQQEWRKRLQEAAAAGDEKAKAKIEERKEKAREYSRKKRKARKEAQ